MVHIWSLCKLLSGFEFTSILFYGLLWDFSQKYLQLSNYLCLSNLWLSELSVHPIRNVNRDLAKHNWPWKCSICTETISRNDFNVLPCYKGPRRPIKAFLISNEMASQMPDFKSSGCVVWKHPEQQYLLTRYHQLMASMWPKWQEILRFNHPSFLD